MLPIDESAEYEVDPDADADGEYALEDIDETTISAGDEEAQAKIGKELLET